MLGLATHEPHFRVLREDVFFQESKARTCRLCGQQGHKPEECRGQAKEKNGEFDEKGKGTSLKPFIWLHVSVLREYLAAELYVPRQPFPFDLERALDDWVFMCFFVGNDFLPHLPSLDIRENGIDTLIAIWRDNIPLMDGYVTKDGHVDLKRTQLILQGLAKQEDGIFRRRRQVEERRSANEKRRKQEQEARKEEHSRKRRRSSPNYNSPAANRPRGVPDINDVELITPGRGELPRQTRELNYNLVMNRGAVYKANMANKSAAEVLKSKLVNGSQNDQNEENGAPASIGDGTPDAKPEPTSPSALGKRKAEAVEEEPAEEGASNEPSAPQQPKEDEPPVDTVRLWEPGYADRYYEQKFGVDPNDHEFRHKVARAYAEGLSWVLLYYFQGCPSWTWYYPYHYAPFAADFVDIGDMDIHFDKGTPFRPFEQLMGVLPASSNHAIPEVFHGLMSDPNSEIIDFYPDDFAVDLNGKKFAWQGVVLLPFIDEQRLLAAMEKKYPLLTEDERLRNTMGRDVLLLSDHHPLYVDLTGNFYSKKPGPPKYKLNMRNSEGLAGKVERNELYIPHSSLVSPLEQYGMPSLDEDHSLTYDDSSLFILVCIRSLTESTNSVNYEVPKSSNVHKSMLLRGVRFPPPALDNSDIQAVKTKAQHAGRSYGGAPLRNGRHDRNGPINYAADRPNPFAAHLDPSFVPPPSVGIPMMPSGWVPPAPGSAGFSRGPPPPPRGGMGNQFWSPYNQGQGYHGAAYNQGGYYGQNPRNQYGHYGQPPYQSNHSSQPKPYRGQHSGRGSYDRRGGSSYRGGGYRGGHDSYRGGYGGYGRY